MHEKIHTGVTLRPCSRYIYIIPCARPWRLVGLDGSGRLGLCQLVKVEALVPWERSLTYQQLDDISRRLAAHLWPAYGLRVGIRVALLFEKSLFAMVAMLAVLKIGAANVALSPSHPPDRLRWLIDDVDAEFILFSETYQSLAQDISPGGCFRVGPSMLIGDVLQGEKGAQNITPDDVSFLLFTGGSTGKPKAIMIDHVAFYSSIKGHGGILCYHQGSRNL